MRDYPDRRGPKREPPEEISVRRDTLVRLCEALEEISSRLQNQIYWLKQTTEIRRLRWRCLACGQIRIFAKPQPVDVATPCPKCHGQKLEPAP